MIVTLLTDFGQKDEYAGVMKGVILSINPAAQLVDLSHEIPPGDVVRATWQLSWAWGYFPAGTVHVAVVDPGVGSSRRILCASHQGHRFLAPDNGLLSLVLAKARKPSLHSVSNRRFFLPKISRTFHGRDIFASVAAHLSLGVSPERLGPKVRSYRRIPLPRSGPAGAGRWVGFVIQEDRFGNAVTNIPEEALFRLGRKGKLRVHFKGLVLAGVARSYSEKPPGEPLAILGSRGLLEIAVNRGSAMSDLGLALGDRVEVRAAR